MRLDISWSVKHRRVLGGGPVLVGRRDLQRGISKGWLARKEIVEDIKYALEWQRKGYTS